MMMSREASRLASDFGTSVPNVSRHLLFTFGGQALGASGRPPALAARKRDRRPEAAGLEGTVIWLP